MHKAQVKIYEFLCNIYWWYNACFFGEPTVSRLVAGSDKVNASLSITIAVFFFVAALFIKRSSSPPGT